MKYKNKKYIYLLILIVTVFFGTKMVFAEECNPSYFGDPNDEYSLAWVIDTGLNILKWSAPVLVIIYGSIDLFKAVIASSADQMTKAQKTIIKRIVIAVILFFVPTLVQILLKAAGTCVGNI